MRKFITHIRNRIKLNKTAFIVYTVLRLLVIIIAIRCLVVGDFESFATCILALVLFLLPALFEQLFKVEVPPLFQIIIYVFIFTSEILGEINRFYTKIPGWDTIHHTLSGFLFAAVGFALVDLFNRKKDGLNLSPLYLAIVAFCFSMTIGVLWEFIEFGADKIFVVDMQKDFIVNTFASNKLDPTGAARITVQDITSTIIQTATGDVTVEGGYLDIGILDTMKDLLVNFIGAVVFSIIGFIYVRGKNKNSKRNIAGKLILKGLSDEEYDALEEEIRKLDEEAEAKRKILRNRKKEKEQEKEQEKETSE